MAKTRIVERARRAITDPTILAIQDEAMQRSLADDGRSSPQERFRIRNELRSDMGLAPERRERGGVAGFYDENKAWLTPVAAGLAGLMTGGLAAPMLIGAAQGGFDRPGEGGIGFDVGGAARGAARGAAAGSVGRFASGFLNPVPAAGAAGATAASTAPATIPNPIPGGPPIPTGATAAPVAAGGAGIGSRIGSVVNRAGDFLRSPAAQNLMKAGTAAYGVYQQAQGNEMMQDAANRDAARWAAGAPLRAQGMQGMLNPIPADTSALAALSGQGNPFARRTNNPSGTGTLARDVNEERPGLQLRPVPTGGR